MTASFKHLRDLHKEESGLLLKSGYGLTSKALNPSNLERQDVKLVLQVFNPHVAEALTARSGEVDFQHAAATADFIRVILRWWSIVNVKTPNKGYHHRNVYEEPMADHTDDPKARFLSAFITWLDVWEFYRHDTGVLTQETLSALRLSAQSLLALVKYCVSELHFKYVLLGKVQTDPLESRFGQYRQMAGGQYHISVRQLCETEGRIRLQNALPRMSSDDLKGIEEVHVTDVGISCSVEVHDADLDQLRAQMPVIGYVGGYCAHAAIKDLKCKSCQGHLVITANEAETEEDSHSLITKLDRGDISWPHQRWPTTCKVDTMPTSVCEAVPQDRQIMAAHSIQRLSKQMKAVEHQLLPQLPKKWAKPTFTGLLLKMCQKNQFVRGTETKEKI
ncbi:hypothetical protein HPB50_015045 [Hyalomma asiaticum]|uniref:Uncharacterized protein n=1 Tax=Hyalomma asiaticum TaxID=266040 RepID=A0ACB7RWC8_HYAAI|nr:hypothetical protein HPB50_015045 [Hyalomma asiaticum]